jgi:hypothetical protein
VTSYGADVAARPATTDNQTDTRERATLFARRSSAAALLTTASRFPVSWPRLFHGPDNAIRAVIVVDGAPRL